MNTQHTETLDMQQKQYEQQSSQSTLKKMLNNLTIHLKN